MGHLLLAVTRSQVAVTPPATGMAFNTKYLFVSLSALCIATKDWHLLWANMEALLKATIGNLSGIFQGGLLSYVVTANWVTYLFIAVLSYCLRNWSCIKDMTYKVLFRVQTVTVTQCSL